MGQTYYKHGGLPAEVVHAVNYLILREHMTVEGVLQCVRAKDLEHLQAMRVVIRYYHKAEAHAVKFEEYVDEHQQHQQIDAVIAEYDNAVEEAAMADTKDEKRIAEGKAWGICIALTALGYDVPGVTRDRGRERVEQ